jgi:Ran GTPase-activating protein (RanGAP) involved in mRNA processing and transport
VSKDLVPLIEFMAANPTIYRLDLSENPLFEDKDNHKEVVQLFACGGPLTHCYLSNVGFNDMAAQELKQAIAKSSVVEHLDLRFNHLSANGVAAVIKALIPGAEPDQKVITSIREVRLFNNAYDDGADDEIIRGAVRQGIKNIKEFTKNDPELGAVVTGGWAIELRAVSFNYIFQIGRYPEDPDEFNTGAVLSDLSARQMKL